MTLSHGLTATSCLYNSPCLLTRSLVWPPMRKFDSTCSDSLGTWPLKGMPRVVPDLVLVPLHRELGLTCVVSLTKLQGSWWLEPSNEVWEDTTSSCNGSHPCRRHGPGTRAKRMRD